MPGQICNPTARAFPLTLCVILAIAVGGAVSLLPADDGRSSESAGLSVVCDPKDGLRPAAEEMARESGARILDSWPVPDGGFAIWIAEPSRLSDREVTDFARLWRDRFPGTAVGIITGRSPAQSLALWRRARKARGGPSGVFVQNSGVARSRFLEALCDSGYLTFTGHAGPGFLQLSDSVLKSRDLPELSGVVVGTESCNVFRLWDNDSIALAIAERGAAAFAGYVYSPDLGYLMGGSGGQPLRFATPDFPVGRVIQLQNRSTMQGMMAHPIYLLLGDPQMALVQSPPWRVVEDHPETGSRLLTIVDAPRGILPVRIPGGAGYTRIETGNCRTSAGYRFYNSRLQAMDTGEDNFLLVDHPGGELRLHLWRETPLAWSARTVLKDALDQTLVFVAASGIAFLGDVAADCDADEAPALCVNTSCTYRPSRILLLTTYTNSEHTVPVGYLKRHEHSKGRM